MPDPDAGNAGALQHPKISVRGLNVRYGARQVLHDIDIEIPDNKVTTFIGPSGCGKTTLLRSLNRLHDTARDVHVQGKVLVGGEDIYGRGVEVTGIRRKMGLLSQRPVPLPMSIYDNVAYGPRLHGTRERVLLDDLVERRLRDTALWEEVKDRLDASATTLSIGQQQRLCLARGLAVDPEIILGDEPTSALDPRSTQTIEELLIRLKEDYTIILVTHILRQARRVSDYVGFMYEGRIIEFGPTEQILLDPQQELTREYVRGYIS